MVKLIGIDLDQTLLRSDKSYERERFNDVIEKLHEQNVLIAIITGNSYQKVVDYFDQNELNTLYFCCENGNVIIKDGKPLHSITIDAKTVTDIIRYLNRYPDYSPVLTINNASYIGENRLQYLSSIERYNPDITINSDLSTVPLEDGVNKIAIFSQYSLDENKALAKELNQAFSGVHSVTSGDGWTDVYHHQGGKGEAVRYLQEKYGITPEATMVFGDSLNDASMMPKAHYSIAMANADDDLKAFATYHIGTNEDQAVIQVLEAIIEDPSLAFMENFKKEN